MSASGSRTRFGTRMAGPPATMPSASPRAPASPTRRADRSHRRIRPAPFSGCPDPVDARRGPALAPADAEGEAAAVMALGGALRLLAADRGARPGIAQQMPQRAGHE